MANPLDLLHHCVILHFVADHSQGEPEFCVISDQKATWLLCGIVTQKTAGSSEYWEVKSVDLFPTTPPSMLFFLSTK